MRRHVVAAVMVVSLIITGSAMAMENRVSNQAELSYVSTAGNTETENLAVKNELKYKFTEALAGSWKLAAIYGETDGVRTAERYRTELRLGYDLSERIYAGLLAGWLKDKFAGLDPRYNAGPLVGIHVLRGERNTLKLECGVDYVREEYLNDTSAEYTRGRGLGEYAYAFNNKNKFIQTGEYMVDFDESKNYQARSISALTNALSDNMSLKISYEINYNNMPPVDAVTGARLYEYTDRILGVTLVVNFN